MLRLHLLTVVAILPATVFALLEFYPAQSHSPSSPWTPSKYIIQMYKKLGQKSPFTPNQTTDEEELSRIIVELLAWIPPEYITQNFPYYFAGYSYEGKPVWIVEAGKFDVNDLIRQGPAMVEAAEIALEQALLHILKSMDDGRLSDGDIPRAQLIYDLDGMSAQKLSHPQAFTLALKIAHRYLDAASYGLDTAIGINSNYFVETFVNLLRPVLGQLMERVEIYGSNKNKWQPRLRRLLPPSSLPPWYGGDPDFKPIAAYG